MNEMEAAVVASGGGKKQNPFDDALIPKKICMLKMIWSLVGNLNCNYKQKEPLQSLSFSKSSTKSSHFPPKLYI